MSEPSLQAITGFALVTADLESLVQFYCDVLGFAAQGADTPIDRSEMALLGLAGGGRRQVLSLGEQILWIDQYEFGGRAYPGQGNAASLWFQHLAIVVDDMRSAYGRVAGATPISRTGPQLLPQSSGGVEAFKFRDVDGHPLELLQFPADTVPDAWRGRGRLGGQIGLGIDHSAISVADADASTAFYQARGLHRRTQSVNEGPAQQRLDGLAAVEVGVVPLMALGGTPHLELLGYRIPRGQAGPALKANDVAATRIVWRGQAEGLIRDPDGHLHQIQT